MANGLLYRLIFDPQGSELAGALDCESDVFLTTYGNTAAQLRAEYGPYDSQSVFVALLDTHDVALAACRMIMPGPAGLKSINDLARPPWSIDGHRVARAVGIDLTRTWDIATIAVRKDAGPIRPLAAAAMYHGLWTAARANGVLSIVMIMDERARRLLSAATILTEPLPGTGPGNYLGCATSTPLYGHLAKMADAQRRINAEAYRLIARGIGLDGIDVPTFAQFQLERTPALRAG